MDEHEYDANMEFGKAYLDIMLRVVEEGYGFISHEIEKWKDIGQNALLQSFSDTVGGDWNELQQDNSNSLPVNPSNTGIDTKNSQGKKKATSTDLALEIGETFFDSFSLVERVSTSILLWFL